MLVNPSPRAVTPISGFRAKAEFGAHCVVAAKGSVFVCESKKGGLIVFRDGYPSSRWRPQGR
jgi:hypothetical protein